MFPLFVNERAGALLLVLGVVPSSSRGRGGKLSNLGVPGGKLGFELSNPLGLGGIVLLKPGVVTAEEVRGLALRGRGADLAFELSDPGVPGGKLLLGGGNLHKPEFHELNVFRVKLLRAGSLGCNEGGISFLEIRNPLVLFVDLFPEAPVLLQKRTVGTQEQVRAPGGNTTVPGGILLLDSAARIGKGSGALTLQGAAWRAGRHLGFLRCARPKPSFITVQTLKRIINNVCLDSIFGPRIDIF